MDSRRAAIVGGLVLLTGVFAYYKTNSTRMSALSPALTDGIVPLVSQTQHSDTAIGDIPVVAWAFRTKDCLSCQTVSREFRRIQQEYGTRIILYGIHVGDETAAVEQFFTEERLDARILHLNADEYRRVFGLQELPAVYLFHRGMMIRVGRDMQGDGGSPLTLRDLLDTVACTSSRIGEARQ